MEEKQRISIINLILIIMLVVCLVMGGLLIILAKNKAEIIGRRGEKIKNNYATEETSGQQWDISATENDHVIATLSSDGELTISGTGDMKDWNYSDTTDWHGMKNQVITVIIENGITSIGSEAFCSCKGLTSIEIPSSVTIIGSGAFRGCSNLTIIENLSGVTSIGISAFSNCSSLTSIKVNENNINFTDEDGVLYTKDKATIVQYPAGKEETQYTILNCVTSIREYAFCKCDNLTSIEIPSGVTSIMSSAFSGCSNLTSIEIPSGVTNILKYTFYQCSSLTSVEIPNGVTSIEAAAFYECSSLTSMKIPSSVTTIGSSAFYGCEQLIIICKSETAAETYAKEKSITYQIDDQIPNINITQNGTETKVKSATPTVLITDELAGVDKNNLKYLWSEEEDGITKENMTNKFENGETLEIKDETGIYYLWIYVSDNVGNEIIQKSNEFYIDNTPPTANVTYSLSRNKDQNTVTITSEEELQSVTDWTLSLDKLTLTKIYTENTGADGENVEIKDIAGNSTTVNIKVAEIEERPFSFTKYVINDIYITKIQPNTQYEDFIKNIQTNISYEIKEGDKVVDSTSIMKTGQVLTIEDKSYTIVVTGDCNGDGQAELKDILAINKHRLNKVSLTTEYLQGADVNGDGVADLKDILQINKFRLGKIEEL